MALFGFDAIAGALGVPVVLVVLFLIWTAIWKGIALWKSGRNKQLVWFIVLFLVNTAGILEIIYLLFFQKQGAWARKKKK